MSSIKTQLLLCILVCTFKLSSAQQLQLYFERIDSSEISEMGYMEESEGELVHKAILTEDGTASLMDMLEKQLKESNNGNIIFYIHGMMAHTKWYQQMVQNKMHQGLYAKKENDVDIVISLVWHGTMDYEQNYVDAYSIGKAYYPLVDQIQALSKRYDADREIHFIMHSMGSRTFQGIYDSFIQKENKDWQAKHVLFVASDAPEDSFYKDGVFAQIDKFSEYIHVYKNQHDFTLGISRGINKQDRIGLNGISDMTQVSDAISVINVSVLNDNEGMMKLTGHRYFFESPTVRKDILRILNNGSKETGKRDIQKDSVLARTFILIK